MRSMLFLLAIGGLIFTSCKDKQLTPEEQLQEDIKIIQEYASKNGLVTQSTPSGLHYVITKEGFGDHPTLSDSVKVEYTGYLTTGLVFDETDAGQPRTFRLSNLIQGWQEGIPLLRKTGKGTFLIPSALAYGPQGQGNIDGNTVLIFDIQLNDF